MFSSPFFPPCLCLTHEQAHYRDTKEDVKHLFGGRAQFLQSLLMSILVSGGVLDLCCSFPLLLVISNPLTFSFTLCSILQITVYS